MGMPILSEKDLTELHEFIVNNPELEILEAKLEEFNPFTVLKIETVEIRHSNVLGWLFDPQENHGLGDKIFKKVLGDLLVSNEHINSPIRISDIYSMDFRDLEVYREKDNIDILAVSQRNNLVCFIENKIRAKESENQLNKYIAKIKKEYPDYQMIPVLLTQYGDEKEEYYVYSHTQIYKIVKFVVDLVKENINARVFDFINFYLKTLEVLTMQNQEIINLAKTIYQKHKRAIDLINEYGITSPIDPVLDSFKSQHSNNIIELYRRSNSFWFIPKDFTNRLPKIAANWESPYPVAFWFRIKREEGKIGLILEIGPFLDPSLRIKFMNHVKKSGKFRVPDMGLRPESKYTRIYSEYKSFADWDNFESLSTQINGLFLSEKAKNAQHNIKDLIESFKWDTKV
jgi:hypothetical protein